MGRHLLKVSHAGSGFITTLQPGGRVLERKVDDPERSWRGRWRRHGPALHIEIGSYSLEIPAAMGDGPWWGREISRCGKSPVEFTVALPALVDARSNNRWGVAKVFGDSRVHLAEMSADMRLREYPIQQGALQDSWEGSWGITSKGLEIQVGQYNWIGHAQVSIPGLYYGLETGPEGAKALNCVTYRLRHTESSNPVQVLLDSEGARVSASLLGAAMKGFIS